MARCGLQMAMSCWAKQVRLECVAMAVSLRKLFSGRLCSKLELNREVEIFLAETRNRGSQGPGVPRRQAVVSHMTPRNQGLTDARKMPSSSQQFQKELAQEPTQKDLAGGPVVRTPWSQGRGSRFNPQSGNNNSHIPPPRARMPQLRPGAAKIKQRATHPRPASAPWAQHSWQTTSTGLWKGPCGRQVEPQSPCLVVTPTWRGGFWFMRQLLSAGLRPATQSWLDIRLLGPLPFSASVLSRLQRKGSQLPSSPLPPGRGPLCAQILSSAF